MPSISRSVTTARGTSCRTSPARRRDRLRTARPVGDVASRARRDGAPRDRLDRPLHGLDAAGARRLLARRARGSSSSPAVSTIRPTSTTSYLAVQLGVHLVEGADLVVRQRRVAAHARRSGAGRRALPAAGGPDRRSAGGRRPRIAGVPGVLQAVRSGGVALANAHGSGVVEAPELAAFVEAAISRLRPTAASLPRLVDASTPLARVPTTPGAGRADGRGVGRVADVRGRRRGRTSPCCRVARGACWRQGTIHAIRRRAWPRTCGCSVTLAPDRRTAVAAGRFRAIAADAQPTPCTGRTVPRTGGRRWRTARRSPRRPSRIPDCRSSTAGNGTVASRRCCRRRRRGSGTTGDLHAELQWLTDAVARDRDAADRGDDGPRVPVGDDRSRWHTLPSCGPRSTRTRPASTISTPCSPTSRSPGCGTRASCASGVADRGHRASAGAGAGGARPRRGGRGWRVAAPAGSADVEAAVVEVLLAANESLVAYRRRHRSDVELEAAISLLIHDDTNPRSLVSAIDRLERTRWRATGRSSVSSPSGRGRRWRCRWASFLPAARAVIDQAGVL